MLSEEQTNPAFVASKHTILASCVAVSTLGRDPGQVAFQLINKLPAAPQATQIMDERGI